MKTYQPYIDGGFVAPQSADAVDVIDPATTEVIARVPDMSAADVDRAVKAARLAFDEGPWRETTAQDRGRILFKLAQIVRDRADELAEIETRNSGKPIVEAEFDIADVATCFEYYGGMATKIQGDVLPVPDNAMSLALREPMGVAGQIVPWNYPLLMAVVEAGAGDLRRLHGRAEAGRADAAHRSRAGLELRRGGAASRRRQHRDGRRRNGWSRDRRARRRGQDRVYRQRRGRQDHHARRRGHA